MRQVSDKSSINKAGVGGPNSAEDIVRLYLSTRNPVLPQPHIPSPPPPLLPFVPENVLVWTNYNRNKRNACV